MKRAWSILLTLSVLFVSVCGWASAAVTGDLDGNGVVKANDARIVLRAAAGLEVLSELQRAAADVNTDGTVKANDARLILRVAAGLASFEISGKLTVSVLDVGQGDSVFIELPSGKCILIDAAESKYSAVISGYISSRGYDTIDYLVATHPHADHIGGMAEIVESFDIGEVYMPKATATTKTYENLLSALAAKGESVTRAKAGVKLISEAGLSAVFIAPVYDTYTEMNNYSAVLKLDYGDNSFLFMGDAEALSENEITADVDADVIKVGHHGSDTSSSPVFVSKVSARYAVISVGAGNRYSHPSETVVSRWESSGAQVLRTDKDGTVVFISDGKSLSVKTESSVSPNSPICIFPRFFSEMYYASIFRR